MTNGALAHSPPLALLALEPMRALLEFAASRLAAHEHLPPGDGHPVVIFPGLAADKAAVGPLRGFCERLGYAAYDWGRGVNTGPKGELETWIDELCADVLARQREHGRRVSLVGWSLGGIYAREVAKKVPHAVRQVVTLGAPFGGSGEHTNVGWLYRLLSGQAPVVDEVLRRRLCTPPEVPTTAIYSRTDGVVAWQCCVERDAPQVESIEVNEASHVGLVWNPRVWSIVADRLSQPEGGWRRYEEPAGTASPARRMGLSARECS